MPFAYNGSIRIHYQVRGTPAGAPLLLHHGFTQNLHSWHMRGYSKALGERFRLILLDARGHGQSDKPQDPNAYGLDQRVGDVLAVLDALKLPRSHFLGYSMGGRVGFALAQQAPQRLDKLAIGGAHPDSSSQQPENGPDPNTSDLNTSALNTSDLNTSDFNASDFNAFVGVDGRDPTAFIAAFEAMIGEPLSPLAQEFVKANDLIALAALAQPRPGLVLEPSAWNRPILLFAGDRDRRFPQLQAWAQQLPQAEFKVLPGLSHVAAIADSAKVLPILEAFF
jgi:pimeloyl-ACP methyl ester carboxylesterase